MMDGIYEIMCYGDSNTWGTVARPHKDAPHLRYGRDVRWPCVLQKLLGDGCAVREEGLGGRTTIYTANPAMPFKNGLHMLEGCLKTHAPLDLVILMLGTNDLHQPEPLPEAEMGHGITTLVELIQAHPEYGPEEKRPPEILLIAPPFITPSAPDARTEVYGQFCTWTRRATAGWRRRCGIRSWKSGRGGKRHERDEQRTAEAAHALQKALAFGSGHGGLGRSRLPALSYRSVRGL